MTTAETCPNQRELLTILNNPAAVSAAALQDAHRLMQKWFGFAYSVWQSHNA